MRRSRGCSAWGGEGLEVHPWEQRRQLVSIEFTPRIDGGDLQLRGGDVLEELVSDVEVEVGEVGPWAEAGAAASNVYVEVSRALRAGRGRPEKAVLEHANADSPTQDPSPGH